MCRDQRIGEGPAGREREDFDGELKKEEDCNGEKKKATRFFFFFGDFF